MVDKWVFFVAFFELLVSCLVLLYVIRLQLNTFKTKSELQPLKRLLLSLVTILIITHTPLMIIYATTVWGSFHNLLLVYVAVLGNASSAVIGSFLLYTIYKYQSKD